MPRLIDADALDAYIRDYACIPCKKYGADRDGVRCEFCGYGFCLDGIKRHKTIEVVRCRGCKHRDEETGFCEGRGWPMQLVPDDGFCDKGKRRTDA